MAEITHLKPEQAREARRMIYTVAYELFEHKLATPEEAFAHYDDRWPIPDVEDYQRAYVENGGVFLVLMDEGRIIGSGALRRLDESAAELKRIWLLPEYQGQGLGYQITMRLLALAREMGYKIARLETSPAYQQRAYHFYRKVGFYEIPRYGDDPDDVGMEMVLEP